MLFRLIVPSILLFRIFLSAEPTSLADTLPPYQEGAVPQNYVDLWADFDPRKEPLDVEVLHSWEEGEVRLQVVRYRVGVFKGQKAMMAGVYGYPKGRTGLPALLQIHGGGQYADFQAPLTNARRGYATLSIAWAGRISTPAYRVSPVEVKLFWDGKISDPSYKLTTDWGALDAYHAPSRYGKDAFPSIPVADWTIDPVESPRNNSWFLVAVGARRGLTFLERQPEVDASNLGVYGHSMGGKLTVLTSGSDSRVKAAAPSCGGMSDRYSSNPLHLATVSDPPSLKSISCPIIFLSPANDFHGRINDLPTAISEIKTKDWRVTISPHHNHQDTPPYEVATQLWFDQYLKNTFSFPESPRIFLNLKAGEDPIAVVEVDESTEVSSIDVFYSQQGQVDGKKDNSQNTKNRFWHHATVSTKEGKWKARLPIFSVERPLWAYANVQYKLKKQIVGAGYYYGTFKADTFNLSSLPELISPKRLKASGAAENLDPTLIIEDFQENWEKEWFTYKPHLWGIKTHKIYDPVWAAPKGAKLSFEVRSKLDNKLVVGLDSYVSEINLKGGANWNFVSLTPDDFYNFEGNYLAGWSNLKELRFEAEETLRPGKGSSAKPRKIGAAWKGQEPEFANLRWE